VTGSGGLIHPWLEEEEEEEEEESSNNKNNNNKFIIPLLRQFSLLTSRVDRYISHITKLWRDVYYTYTNNLYKLEH
jgi:hypothetical protein